MDIIYPPVCPICREVLWEKKRVCTECAGKLEYVKEPICLKCGKEIDYEEGEYCSDCAGGKHLFTAGRAVFRYRNDIKRSIYDFKYRNKREFAPFYAEEIATHCGEWIERVAPQVLIPVPLHPSKQRARGYNQAELLASCLSEYTSIPMANDLIYRVKKTTPQKELSDNYRKKNMKKAFKMAENIVKLDTVMIIDDIYTTGSTMDAMSVCLLEAGVKEIYCLSLCIGNGF